MNSYVDGWESIQNLWVPEDGYKIWSYNEGDDILWSSPRSTTAVDQRVGTDVDSRLCFQQNTECVSYRTQRREYIMYQYIFMLTYRHVNLSLELHLWFLGKHCCVTYDLMPRTAPRWEWTLPPNHGHDDLEGMTGLTYDPWMRACSHKKQNLTKPDV